MLLNVALHYAIIENSSTYFNHRWSIIL